MQIGKSGHSLAVRLPAGFAGRDALIVAAALEAGCGTLFSAAMQDGRVVGRRLPIRTPFAVA
ncbi:hypothetical protein ACFQS7_28480 [Dankookia sp. GCM10030260]|uniref:hypothetical protein n=1 Tax=Dankookia sp. GCM10030260 TaxID=3273390 RepID=UPI00361ACF15